MQSLSYKYSRNVNQALYNPYMKEATKLTSSRKKILKQLEDNYANKKYDYSYMDDNKRSGLDRVFDALSVGNYASAGFVKGMVDNGQKGDESPLRAMWEGIKASNPIGEGNPDHEYTYSRVMEEAGWKPQSTLGKIGKGTLGFVGDVLLDPLTYLTGGVSSLVKGTGKIGKGALALNKTAEAIAKYSHEADVAKKMFNIDLKGGEGLTKALSNKVRKELTQSGALTGKKPSVVTRIVREETTKLKDLAKPELDKFDVTKVKHQEMSLPTAEYLVKKSYGSKLADVTPEQLAKDTEHLSSEYNRLMGYRKAEPLTFGLANAPFIGHKMPNAKVTLLKDTTALQRVGDKTIAPLYNKLRNSIYSGVVGKMFSANNSPLYRIAKESPDELFKSLKFLEIRQGLSVDKVKAEKEFRDYAKSLNISPAEQKEIMKAMEDKTIWTKVKDVIRLQDTDEGKLHKKALYEQRNQATQVLQELQNRKNTLDQLRTARKESLDRGQTKIVDQRAILRAEEEYANSLAQVQKMDMPTSAHQKVVENMTKAHEQELASVNVHHDEVPTLDVKKETLNDLEEKAVKEDPTYTKIKGTRLFKPFTELKTARGQVMDMYNHLTQARTMSGKPQKEQLKALTQKLEYFLRNQNGGELPWTHKLAQGKDFSFVNQLSPDGFQMFFNMLFHGEVNPKSIAQMPKTIRAEDINKAIAYALNNPITYSERGTRASRIAGREIGYGQRKTNKTWHELYSKPKAELDKKINAIPMGEAMPEEYKTELKRLESYRKKRESVLGQYMNMDDETFLKVEQEKANSEVIQSIDDVRNMTFDNELDGKKSSQIDENKQRTKLIDDISASADRKQSNYKPSTISQKANAVARQESDQAFTFRHSPNGNPDTNDDLIDFQNQLRNKLAKYVNLEKTTPEQLQQLMFNAEDIGEVELNLWGKHFSDMEDWQQAKVVDKSIEYLASKKLIVQPLEKTSAFKKPPTKEEWQKARQKEMADELKKAKSEKLAQDIKVKADANNQERVQYVKDNIGKGSEITFKTKDGKELTGIVNRKTFDESNGGFKLDVRYTDENLKDARGQALENRVTISHQDVVSTKVDALHADDMEVGNYTQPEHTWTHYTDDKKNVKSILSDGLKEHGKEHVALTRDGSRWSQAIDMETGEVGKPRTGISYTLDKSARIMDINSINDLEDVITSGTKFTEGSMDIVESLAEEVRQGGDLSKILSKTLKAKGWDGVRIKGAQEWLPEEVKALFGNDDLLVFNQNVLSNAKPSEAVQIKKPKMMVEEEQRAKDVMQEVEHVKERLQLPQVTAQDVKGVIEPVKTPVEVKQEKVLHQTSKQYQEAIAKLDQSKAEYQTMKDQWIALQNRVTNTDAEINQVLKEMDAYHAKVKEFDTLLNDSDMFESFLKTNYMNSLTYKGMPLIKPDGRDLEVFDTLDTLDAHQKDMVKSLRSQFNSIGQEEVRIGRLKKEQVDEMMFHYLPHVATAEFQAFLKSGLIEKKNPFLTQMLGYDVKFSPYGKARTAKKIKLGGEWIENPNVEQLNQYFKETLGDAFNGNAFVDSLPDIFLNRAMKHTELIYDHKYMTTMMDMFGKQYLPNGQLLDGHKMVMNFGQFRRSVYNAVKSDARINKVTHTRETFMESVDQMLTDMDLPPSILKYDALPMIELNPNQANLVTQKFPVVYQVNDFIVDKTNALRKMQIAKDESRFLQVWDKFMHWFKVNQTTVMPGFHIGNKTANVFQNYLAVGSDAFDLNFQKMAYLAVKHDGDSSKLGRGLSNVEDVIVQHGTGDIYKWSDLYHMAKQYGVVDSGMFAKDIGAESADVLAGKPSNWNPFDTNNFKLYRKGGEIGSLVESSDRLVQFASWIKQGVSPENASELVNKFLFDYTDVTMFERNVMKRIFPYYTWLRKNMRLQTNEVIEQPGKYLLASKMMNAVDSMSNPEDKLQDGQREGFAKDWLQLPFNIGGNPALINPRMPFQDLSRMASTLNPLDPMGSLKNAISLTAPMIKAPIELLSNQNMYFGGELKGASESEASAVGDYAIGQLSLYSSLKDLVTKDNKGLVALNALTGTKIMSYDKDMFYAMRSKRGADAPTVNDFFSGMMEKIGETNTGQNVSKVLGAKLHAFNSTMAERFPDTFGWMDTNVVLIDGATIDLDDKHPYLPAQVSKVVDGDTIKVRLGDKTKDEEVRFLLVDTPETVKPNTPVMPGGKEASNYTKAQLTDKNIELYFDTTTRDKYGRLLAYVHVAGEDFNKDLLEKGYARYAYEYDDYDRIKPYKKAQQKAIDAKKGIWNVQDYIDPNNSEAGFNPNVTLANQTTYR